MNKELIIALSKLQEIMTILGDEYRAKAYKGAVSELKKLNFEITPATLNQFKQMKIPGIGEGITYKITEFVTRGRMAELDKLEASKAVKSFRELSGIAGVGPATINTWRDMDIDTLPKLRRAVARGRVVLNKVQKYGLVYYDDLNTRIPRDEVTALSDIIYRVLARINPNIIFTIAGSYRRGAATCGDIDIVISARANGGIVERARPKIKSVTPRSGRKSAEPARPISRRKIAGDVTHIIADFVEQIHADPNFIDVLSQGRSNVTFIYRSPLSNKVRQIDILNLPWNEYWPGVLYFTGSKASNVRMRAIAKAMGYRLTVTGLYKVHGKKLEPVPMNSEEEIFHTLGIKYVPPPERE